MNRLDKIELEEAVEAALPDLEQRRRSDQVVTAFEDFLSRRFRGGAEAVKRIHQWRLDLIGRPEPMSEVSEAAPGPFDSQPLGEAAEHSAPANLGRLLYALARTFRFQSGVELGTNIGVSAAYTATALQLNDSGLLVTLDGSGPRLDWAQRLFGHLGLDRVETVQGSFTETLRPTLDRVGPIDYAFVDGHHQYQPTLDYFDLVAHHHRPGAVVMLDDIRWSDGMLDAWTEVRADPRVALAVDLSRVGLVVLD